MQRFMLFCISFLSSSLSLIIYLSLRKKEKKQSGIIREEDFTVSIPWELETSWPTVALLIAANHDSSPFRMKQRVSNLRPEGSLSDDDHTDSER